VAFFTGSKNAMKGVGFFLGGLLLQVLGFQHALWAMAGLLAMVLAGVLLFVPPLMQPARPSLEPGVTQPECGSPTPAAGEGFAARRQRRRSILMTR
jgi:hypothetical protein